jgi:hypothetical protein
LRSNTKGYGGKTHYTDSQNSDKTAPSGRELYHWQFPLQTASPETFGYTYVLPILIPFIVRPETTNNLRNVTLGLGIVDGLFITTQKTGTGLM